MHKHTHPTSYRRGGGGHICHQEQILLSESHLERAAHVLRAPGNARCMDPGCNTSTSLGARAGPACPTSRGPPPVPCSLPTPTPPCLFAAMPLCKTSNPCIVGEGRGAGEAGEAGEGGEGPRFLKRSQAMTLVCRLSRAFVPRGLPSTRPQPHSPQDRAGGTRRGAAVAEATAS